MVNGMPWWGDFADQCDDMWQWSAIVYAEREMPAWRIWRWAALIDSMNSRDYCGYVWDFSTP